MVLWPANTHPDFPNRFQGSTPALRFPKSAMGPSSGAPTPPNTIRAPPIGPCGTPKRRRYFANRLPLPAGVSKLILQRGPKPPKVLSNEVPNDPLIFQQCPKPRKWFPTAPKTTKVVFQQCSKYPQNTRVWHSSACNSAQMYFPTPTRPVLSRIYSAISAPDGRRPRHPPASRTNPPPNHAPRHRKALFGRQTTCLGPCPGWGPVRVGAHMGPYGPI